MLNIGQKLKNDFKMDLYVMSALRLESDLHEKPGRIQSCLGKLALGEGGRRMRWMGVGEVHLHL